MGIYEIEIVILSIIVGTLAAIVYSLRILVLLERRIARMDENLLIITKKIAEEEVVIEHEEQSIAREEKKIEGMLKRKKKR